MAKSNANTKSESASAGTTAGGQTSFTEHADKRGAAHTFESRTVDSDIGQTEGWSTNLKRVVDDYAHLIGRVHYNDLRASDNMQRIFEQDWAARLADERVATKSFYNASQNGWNNLTDEEKRVMAQETRHNDIAIDRQWNVDEQGAWVSLAIREIANSSTIKADTAAAIVKTVMDGVSKK